MNDEVKVEVLATAITQIVLLPMLVVGIASISYAFHGYVQWPSVLGMMVGSLAYDTAKTLFKIGKSYASN